MKKILLLLITISSMQSIFAMRFFRKKSAQPTSLQPASPQPTQEFPPIVGEATIEAMNQGERNKPTYKPTNAKLRSPLSTAGHGAGFVPPSTLSADIEYTKKESNINKAPKPLHSLAYREFYFNRTPQARRQHILPVYRLKSAKKTI